MAMAVESSLNNGDASHGNGANGGLNGDCLHNGDGAAAAGGSNGHSHDTILEYLRFRMSNQEKKEKGKEKEI